MNNLLFAVALVFAPLNDAAIPWTPIPQQVQGCCKVCQKGKACGDSCISRDKRCHKGAGCACDG